MTSIRAAGITVLNNNVTVMDGAGNPLTEIDVVTPKALIEYKYGASSAYDVIDQNRKAELCTLLPVIVFIDGHGPAAERTVRGAGRHILITNDFQLLVDLRR